MSISGTYASIQSVTVGSVVQLVYGQEGYVMRVYETGNFTYEIANLNELVGLSVFNNIIYVLIRSSTGLMINAYSGDGMNPIWSQNIGVHLATQIEIVSGPGGVYILFFTENSNIILPGGTSIPASPQYIIVRFSTQGLIISYTTLTGTGGSIPHITYNSGINTAVLYGASTKSLVLGGRTIITSTTLYSYAIILSPSLKASRVFQENSVTILKLSSNSGNIAYVDRSDEITTLSFHSNLNNWTYDLGNFDVNEITVIPNGVFLVGRNIGGLQYLLYSFSPSGVLVSTAVLQISGVLLKAQFSFLANVLLLYTLSNIEAENYIVGEYNVIDDIIVWRTAVPSGTIWLAGSGTTVASGTDSIIDVYGKRLPALVGAVSEILCAGIQNCSSYPRLPNGAFPYTVTVDFILTTAFSKIIPVIPGQEYFLDINGTVTVIPNDQRYIGTALDKSRVLMLATFPPCCSEK